MGVSMPGDRKGKHRARRNAIVVILAAALIIFCVISTLNEKYDFNIDTASDDFPSLGFIYEFIGSLFGSEEPGDYDNATLVMGNISGLEVHYIDVGQGKSILIKGPEQTALIDCGENNMGAVVTGYLKQEKIDRIDVLIGTHPHSDHIGGMDMVIDSVDIGAIIMPDIPDSLVPTTKTYTDVLLAATGKNLTITPAKPGDAYDLGGSAVLTILSPVSEYGDLNNMSVAVRVDYGGTSFVFTGDIEDEAEKDILASGQTLRADVLDVGHHGSQTSSGEAFIGEVSPTIAVISCGMDNSYNHPHREAVERLQAAGAKIYRTDIDGTVVIYSDGNNLKVETEK